MICETKRIDLFVFSFRVCELLVLFSVGHQCTHAERIYILRRRVSVTKDSLQLCITTANHFLRLVIQSLVVLVELVYWIFFGEEASN